MQEGDTLKLIDESMAPKQQHQHLQQQAGQGDDGGIEPKQRRKRKVPATLHFVGLKFGSQCSRERAAGLVQNAKCTPCMHLAVHVTAVPMLHVQTGRSHRTMTAWLQASSHPILNASKDLVR